jgi:hypothetical protein
MIITWVREGVSKLADSKRILLLSMPSAFMSSKKCFPISVRISQLLHSLSVTDLNLHNVNSLIKVKVKFTLLQALRLVTGRTVNRGSRGIALLRLCTDRTAHRGSRGIALLRLCTGRTVNRGSRGIALLRLVTGRTVHRGSRGIALLFHDHGTRSAEESASRPGRSLTPGKSRYPLYRRLDEPHGRSGQVRKISPPPGFDPRTFQPVTIRYTDYATWPTSSLIYMPKLYGAISYPRKTAYHATLRRNSLSSISV